MKYYDYVNKLVKQEDFKRCLNILTSREQKILEIRFGLIDGVKHTLEETGNEFDVSRERIRQIEAKSLEKIKIHMENKKCNFCEKYFPEEELSRPESKEYSHILLCQDDLGKIMAGIIEINPKDETFSNIN